MADRDETLYTYPFINFILRIFAFRNPEIYALTKMTFLKEKMTF